MQVVTNVAAKVDAANGVNKVWECCVAGISPTNKTQVFRTLVLRVLNRAMRTNF
jgi:hypothetical protein